MDTFAKRLAAYMGRMHYSVRGVASMAGADPSTVTGWLKRGHVPRADSVRNLAEASGISADWWLGVRGVKE